jgi:hypothetical protein
MAAPLPEQIAADAMAGGFAGIRELVAEHRALTVAEHIAVMAVNQATQDLVVANHNAAMAANQATHGLVVANHVVAMGAIAANHATAVANHAVAMGAIGANHATSVANHATSVANHATSVANHNAAMDVIAANQAAAVANHATSVANHAVAMGAIGANHATSVANHAVAMGAIGANHATSVANQAVAMDLIGANHAAVMAAIAAIGHVGPGHQGHCFDFVSHCELVRATNSSRIRVNVNARVVPMPLAPVDPLLPGVFAVRPAPPVWRARGYTIHQFHRLTNAQANVLIDAYALVPHGAGLPPKRNAILAHFGFLQLA